MAFRVVLLPVNALPVMGSRVSIELQDLD